MTTYEPGTVAMVTAYNRSEPYRAYFDGKTWRESGAGMFCVDEPTSLRPLVTLDPEDREQVERLARTTHVALTGDVPSWLTLSGKDQVRRMDALTMALHAEIEAQTKPPRPEEPTGLGAQVRDRDGETWVRNAQGAWINLHGRYGLDPAQTWDGLCEKYGPIGVQP